MEKDLIFKKATLALGGGIRLPEGFEIPVRVSRSTAGPGAGNNSLAIGFGGLRVKKSVSYDKGEFELHVGKDGKLSLTHNGAPFLDEITLEPVIHHCPEQAFYTLDPRCAFHCAFCASPKLSKTDFKGTSDEEIAENTRKEYSEGKIVSVALTSGVHDGDVQKEVDRFVSCIKAIRSKVPDIRIGIEPYVRTEEQVRQLKEAGADEIKLNIQTATPELFSKVCPDLDRDSILNCIKAAVKIFGPGRVTSNLIFGLGETREELVDCMESICRLGALPTVRSLRYSAYNTESLKDAIGTPAKVTPEEMLEVARIHKEILDRYGMDTNTFKTMCLECGCCDIVPHRDM